MAVSHPCTGMTFRVLSDHRGAPISAIQSTSKEVRQPQVVMGRGLGCFGQQQVLTPLLSPSMET